MQAEAQAESSAKAQSKPHKLAATDSKPYRVGQDAKSEPKAEIKPASLAHLNLIEHSRQVWFFTPAKGVTIDDLEKPEVWDLLRHKLNSHDRVEGVTACGRWWFELYVAQIDPVADAVIRLMRKFELPEPEEAERRFLPRGFRLDRDPVTHSYAIVRESDGVVLVRDKLNPHDARAELLNHATLRPR